MRTDRRTVLKMATAASAACAAGVAGAAGAWGPAPPRVLYDDRFEAGRAFARVARREGLETFGFSGDLTRLWRYRLRGDWATPAGPVIGLTTPRAMLCLQQLAMEQGWRVMVDRNARVGDPALLRWTLVWRRGVAARAA